MFDRNTPIYHLTLRRNGPLSHKSCGQRAPTSGTSTFARNATADRTFYNISSPGLLRVVSLLPRSLTHLRSLNPSSLPRFLNTHPCAANHAHPVSGTAGSPDGIHNWSDARALSFPAPWRPDCHTNLYYDEPLGQYLMTTRDFVKPDGRLIGIARTGGNRTVFEKNGTWSVRNVGEYPPATSDGACGKEPGDPVGACGTRCMMSASCRYFWTYTKGKSKGTCCLKAAIEPGPLRKPACTTCGGEFFTMGGEEVQSNTSGFDAWLPPAIVERGTSAHQLYVLEYLSVCMSFVCGGGTCMDRNACNILSSTNTRAPPPLPPPPTPPPMVLISYSQITWRFYDIFLGIVMTYDAATGNVGPNAGRVHCMLSWSNDSTTWQWVDGAGLEGLKEFIPHGDVGSFESHVCFAAHSPLRMPDGSSRVYYMAGNGPHSGKRNSSFALATLAPDRFAGMTSVGEGEHGGGGNGREGQVTAVSRWVQVTGATMIVTVDVLTPGGSVSIGVKGASPSFARSTPITTTGTDVPVQFPGQTGGLAPLLGQQVQLEMIVTKATVYTIGFH